MLVVQTYIIVHGFTVQHGGTTNIHGFCNMMIDLGGSFTVLKTIGLEITENKDSLLHGTRSD